MKVLLATTMALGVVLMLGASQTSNAAVIQPTTSAYHQNQIIQARHWHGGYYYGGPGYYYGGPAYYYGDPGICVGPFCIL